MYQALVHRPSSRSRAPRLGKAPLPCSLQDWWLRARLRRRSAAQSPPFQIFNRGARPPDTSAPSRAAVFSAPLLARRSRSATPISSSASMKSLRYAICADIPIGRVAPAAGGGNGKWGPAKGTWLPDATREPGKCLPVNPATQFRER